MGWWEAGDGLIGDEPLDAIGDTLHDVIAMYNEAHGRPPTQEEWAALLNTALHSVLPKEQNVHVQIRSQS
jgi:hypothetical protein